jgi:hypothetical protein
MAEREGKIRNVYMLGLVSFFTYLSSEMVFSLLPLYILGLPGGSITSLGLVEGTAYGVYYLVVGSAFFVSNTVVGRLWESQGLWASSLYSVALTLAAYLGHSLFTRDA